MLTSGADKRMHTIFIAQFYENRVTTKRTILVNKCQNMLHKLSLDKNSIAIL